MEAYVTDWFSLIVRWIHVITGVTWIGTSFYFNWLNNNMRPPLQPSDEVGGEVWSVHGGAFYTVTKYKVAPAEQPKHLHWFKYEAYFTWLSGFTLLALIYYLGADSFLIDKGVADISTWAGIGIGIGTLVGGWIGYDLLCKSALRKKPVALAVIGFLLASGIAFGLTQVFNPRAAYIHFGAMIGTIMAANVFFVIIPNQKVMVGQLTRGEEPDPEMGKAGALRSLHNNYLTLPVLFIMVSNHYPMTFGHEFNWAVLLALSLIGAGVRHWFNLTGQGHKNTWILPVAAIAMFALAFVMRPEVRAVEVAEGNEIQAAERVTWPVAKAIIDARCLPCHAAKTTHPTFVVAQGGVMYDTPEQVKAKVELIKAQAVDSKTMPLGNLTGMTDEERKVLGRWIAEGAPVD